MISPNSNLCVYQFRITLKTIRPPIWRRLLVRNDISLARFHETLQIAMGWKDCHLHQFSIDGQLYSPQNDPDFGLPMLDEDEGEDEAEFALTEFNFGEKDKFHYDYDFGDGWEHEIAVEKTLPVDPKQDYPVCIKGSRACPPEDCGGPWAYGDFLDVVQNTGHPEHKEMLDWVGGKFDSEDFDVDSVNKQLHQAPL